MPIAVTSASTERVETPWTPAFAGAGSGFLDHRGERLLGHPARLQEAREITAPAQLRDAQFDRAVGLQPTGLTRGARLPHPVAVSVAVGDALRAALAVGGAGQALDLQLDQPLPGKANHLAQQCSVRTPLQQRAKARHLVGHPRIKSGDRFLGSVEGFATKPCRRPAMTTAVDKQPAAA